MNTTNRPTQSEVEQCKERMREYLYERGMSRIELNEVMSESVLQGMAEAALRFELED